MRSCIAPVLVAAVLAFGGAHAASLDKQTVKLNRSAIVGGTVVPAGIYRLEVAPGRDTARFVQGKRLIAEVPCKVGLAEVFYPGTAVHYRPESDGRDRLIRIVLSSAKLAIEFPDEIAANDQASSGPATSGRR
ncbi:MAG TPA: hypothetical protein VFB67_12390 [Candidatus Polarisedimenticolaceae bacterium]|nr:hypothetical protein [Candidatus Polarisedimenticolaceae bacterium]